jgi:CubicO group peptidase (beta-lactamase class C family)
MYVVGALIIEAYGRPYMDIVHERLFAPLNMSSSTFVPSEADSTGRATQIWTTDEVRLPWLFKNDLQAQDGSRSRDRRHEGPRASIAFPSAAC